MILRLTKFLHRTSGATGAGRQIGFWTKEWRQTTFKVTIFEWFLIRQEVTDCNNQTARAAARSSAFHE